MKYYLIDYENVNASGLDGIDQIASEDRVVLFYTKHSSKIDLGMFNVLLNISAELTIIEVHHGKQALDIQLGSYVGFLIGTEGLNSEYYIISKDKGYRNIQDFWGEHRIYLHSSIRQAVQKGSRKRQPDEDVNPPADLLLQAAAELPAPSAAEGDEEAPALPAGSDADAQEAAFEEAPCDAPAEDGADDADAGLNDPEDMEAAAAEDAAENVPAETDAAEDTSEDAEEADSASEAEPAGEASEAEEAAAAAPQSAPSRNGRRNARQSSRQKNSSIRNEVNTEIQKRLSKAGYPGDVINATASFVSRNIGKDSYKQLIYRGIIKEHGQKTGLALYRLIKEVL